MNDDVLIERLRRIGNEQSPPTPEIFETVGMLVRKRESKPIQESEDYTAMVLLDLIRRLASK